MTKKFLTFGILLIVLTGILLPNIAFGEEELDELAQILSTVNPVAAVTAKASADGLFSPVEYFFDGFFKIIGHFLMTISSFILIISGKIFDSVVEFTVIDMGKNIGDPKGVGGGITAAWATLRDIANMCFIFVLLFAAFKNMFQYNINNFGATIKNIIIVALLINFSLFFSKVVIDASNIVSVGFYKSIATANTNTYELSGTLTGTKENFGFTGISGGYLRMLGLQTFFGAEILDKVNDPVKILTLGVVSSIFMLVTATILLIAGIMFAARFIILIFLMILSPLALIAYIIPGQEKQFNSWKDSLISQSFFAPLFFALTWVVFKVGSSLLTAVDKNSTWTDLITKADSGAINLLLFYILITGFSIAALVLSKQMATSGATGGAFKAISGGVGTAAIGGAALAGRNTIGRASSLVSEKYRDTLSKNALGRSTLWLANKGKQSSFDARAVGDTKLMKSIGADKYTNDMLGAAGKAGGKGGFAKVIEEKAKAKAAYAKDVYGQTDFEKDEAKKRQTDYDIEKAGEEKKIKQRRLDKVAEKIADARTPEETEKAEAYREYVNKINKKNIFDDKEYSDEFKNKDIVKEYEKYSKAGEKRQEEFAKRLDKTANILTTAGAIVGGVVGGLAGGLPGIAIGSGVGAGLGSTNKAASKKIRLESKGPSKEKKLADIISKEFTETTTSETPATPPPAPTPPTTPSP
ncbi:MAG: hypothetical protein A2431_02915 [Candidatus Zambryskibacteria bacterium RIFOXYC1_FULL_39_10]|uniref:TrbL/VirB6 plasmid conjugal transfer protein n=1 Tax=Candidatus Zambryskibacteria bacterium RIFOXYC1_FULL_39_10 TaxID=1802779 RepID=A0A1G2V021_9BACT|nr:MAG: hypothetical protein A2605_02155 [Candidatus Zambryskibacteria bacterium RIFOXYD1_FULL_39_35]OHB14974.1 MAG: hypothetical protein A2431_02915 [Candidatus Zambryskibacteria bacterium RIFOXYC1_FULL_39_10]